MRTRYLIAFYLLVCNMASAQGLTECKAYIRDGYLILENSLIKRVFLWNEGALISKEIEDKKEGVTWSLEGAKPDFSFPGIGKVFDGRLAVEQEIGNEVVVPHLKAIITATYDSLQVKRVFRIYPKTPAIACDTYLRGQATDLGGTPSKGAGELKNIESEAAKRDELNSTTTDRIALPGRHWQYTAIQFQDATDRNNTLVQEQRMLGYRWPAFLPGHLVWIENVVTKEGLFFLKEAPPPNAQSSYPGTDFVFQWGDIQSVGLGIVSDDLSKENWTKGYSVVLGVGGKGELSRLSALRTYQQQIRRHIPERDEMIMMNTWGDRGQDSHITEAFCIKELEACHRLGITHFQIDDGWQSGQSSNSAFAGGSLQHIWKNPGYWKPNPVRFPGGLAGVVEKAKQLGITLALWFNPSADSNYTHWRDDAGVLMELYQQYGIACFKIDGVQMPNRAAEMNLRKMFDTVLLATHNTAVFNLDATAGRRYGYHYFNEYGNIFLENRYTDWGNYYPHSTLRNLWMLSKYMPPQNLQIEFLNKWRNSKVYENDPLAPAKYSFDYLFAITMVAQPLAWMEGSGLPEEAFRTGGLIRLYKKHKPLFHKGQIFPVGREPDGTGWTGFQSINGKQGYVLIFRERNSSMSESIKLYFESGKKIQFTHLYGQGKTFEATVDKKSEIVFHLNDAFSFAWYHYKILN